MFERVSRSADQRISSSTPDPLQSACRSIGQGTETPSAPKRVAMCERMYHQFMNVCVNG